MLRAKVIYRPYSYDDAAVLFRLWTEASGITAKVKSMARQRNLFGGLDDVIVWYQQVGTKTKGNRNAVQTSSGR